MTGLGSDWGWWYTTGTSALLCHPPSFNSQSRVTWGFSHCFTPHAQLWDTFLIRPPLRWYDSFYKRFRRIFSVWKPGSVLFLLLYWPLLAVCCYYSLWPLSQKAVCWESFSLWSWITLLDLCSYLNKYISK